MEVTLTGKHISITDAIRQYAMEKSLKLPRYYDKLQSIEVIAGKGDSRTYEIELIAHVDRHKHFVARSRGHDLYACIDDTIGKIERQLTDQKEKTRNYKHSVPK